MRIDTTAATIHTLARIIDQSKDCHDPEISRHVTRLVAELNDALADEFALAELRSLDWADVHQRAA